MPHSRELEEIFQERLSNPPVSLEEAIKALAEKPIVLYGAGAFGSENCALLQKHGVSPLAFLDKNAKPGSEKLGVPVYHPDSENLSPSFREKCSVFISITVPARIMEGIKSDLRSWGYGDCQAVQGLTARQVRFEDSREENPGNGYMESTKEKIRRALGCLADEESRQTFLSSLRAHLLRDYSQAYETSFPEQYFDAGVPLSKGLAAFVDCGAYNGDSLIGALRHCEKLDAYMAFEPIVSNFTALSRAVDENRARVLKAFLFPCGVAGHTGQARFNVAASASAITDGGEGEILPLVRLDDALKNTPISFLKMDIEGAELKALRGAENLILEQAPDLAVSVYHFVNHYWDIPGYLSQLNPRYRFYLRAHTAATLETVLYCCE